MKLFTISIDENGVSVAPHSTVYLDVLGTDGLPIMTAVTKTEKIDKFRKLCELLDVSAPRRGCPSYDAPIELWASRIAQKERIDIDLADVFNALWLQLVR